MLSFKKLLLTGYPFIWKSKLRLVKAFSFTDDEIPSVRHVYADSWYNKKSYSENFSHAGIVIGDTIYDADYSIREICEEEGVRLGALESEQKELKRLVAEGSSKIVFEKAQSKAIEALEFAKNDLNRVKEEERAKGNEYPILDYKKHAPNVSRRILEDLHYVSSDGYYSSGLAYDAFYNGVPLVRDKMCLVKVNVSLRETLKYLASEGCNGVLDELVSKAVAEADVELGKANNYIVDNLAMHLIAEEIYEDLVNNKSGSHNLIREVNNSVNSEALNGAKTVNVTAEIEGETFTFNIERSMFRHEYSISEYGISPPTVRRAIAAQLKKRCERENNWCSGKLYLHDILEITYKKKTVYKKGANINV